MYGESCKVPCKGRSDLTSPHRSELGRVVAAPGDQLAVAPLTFFQAGCHCGPVSVLRTKHCSPADWCPSKICAGVAFSVAIGFQSKAVRRSDPLRSAATRPHVLISSQIGASSLELRAGNGAMRIALLYQVPAVIHTLHVPFMWPGFGSAGWKSRSRIRQLKLEGAVKAQLLSHTRLPESRFPKGKGAGWCCTQ